MYIFFVYTYNAFYEFTLLFMQNSLNLIQINFLWIRGAILVMDGQLFTGMNKYLIFFPENII